MGGGREGFDVSLFRPSRRAITSLPWNAGGPRPSLAGVGTMDGALGLVSLYSAVTLILDAISTVPVHTFGEVAGGGRKRVTDPAIVRSPGMPGVGQAAWISQAVASVLLRGNAFGYAPVLDNRGKPVAVKWLHPDTVDCDESGATPRWSVGGHSIDPAHFVHIPGYVVPGSILGLSPLGLFRRQIEQGQQIDASSLEYYRGVRNPRGILANKMRELTPDQIQTTKDRYKASMADHDILVLDNAWDWTSLAVTPADAQFIQASQMTANQVAAIYHVPPDEIGGVAAGGSLTYSTVELNGIKFQQRAVLPWTTRLETAWAAMLPEPRYVKFNLDAALRADFKTRMDGYAVALKNGLLTQDEARELEDRPALTDEQVTEWLEQYVKPAAAQPTAPPATQPGGGQA